MDRLEAANIADGTTATTFSPRQNVTRRQMANFIVRLQEFMAGADITPDNAPNAFTDDNGDNGEAALNVLAAEGVFTGNAAPNAGTVSPGANISRRQMAFVIIRKAQYLFEEGVITRLFDEDDGNQEFTATPAASTTAVFDPVSGNGTPVTVNVSGLDPARDYDVTLVPCSDYSGPSVTNNGVNVLDENGVSSTGGTIGFSDQPTPNDIADDEPSTMYGNAFIATIGFDTINSTSADDISPPADGTLSIRVGTSGGSDCVHVVVFDDNADDDNLNLGGAAVVENDNTPVDLFSLSGAITWSAGDAPTGTDLDDECIVFLNKTANTFILGTGYSFTYGDAGDTYWYSNQHGSGDVNQTITLAEFEAALSLGDCLDNDNSGSNYTRTGSNVFEIAHDYRQNTPSAAAAGAQGDLDGDADATDVTFTWTDPNPGADIDVYEVCVYNATTGASIGCQETDEVDTVGGGDAPLTLVYEDLADGAYVATVSSDSETADGFFDEGPFSAPFLVGAAADVTRPGIADARVTTDAGLQDRFDNGDVVTLSFSEAMNASTAATGNFVLTDGDGDTFNIDCAATAGCVLGDGGTPLTPNDTLVATVNNTIADTNAAGNGVLNMPANITTTNAAVADAAGNVVNLAVPPSADVAIDKEP